MGSVDSFKAKGTLEVGGQSYDYTASLRSRDTTLSRTASRFSWRTCCGPRTGPTSRLTTSVLWAAGTPTPSPRRRAALDLRGGAPRRRVARAHAVVDRAAARRARASARPRSSTSRPTGRSSRSRSCCSIRRSASRCRSASSAFRAPTRPTGSCSPPRASSALVPMMRFVSCSALRLRLQRVGFVARAQPQGAVERDELGTRDAATYPRHFAHALGSRVVSHLRAVPLAARRARRSAARPARRRPGLQALPSRRPDDRARGLPRDPAGAGAAAAARDRGRAAS